jgi:hypothetical protein
MSDAVHSDSVGIIQDLYDAFARRDLPKAFSLLSPDVEIVQSAELPWGGVYQGHDGARQFFGKLTANIQSTLEIERFVSAADHVVAIGWTRGTVNATGATYDVPIAHIWTVRDNLIVEARFYIDHPTMFKALTQKT